MLSPKKRGAHDFGSLALNVEEYAGQPWLPAAVRVHCIEVDLVNAVKFSHYDEAAHLFEKLADHGTPQRRLIDTLERSLARLAPHMGRCCRPPAEARREVHAFMSVVRPALGFLSDSQLKDMDLIRIALATPSDTDLTMIEEQSAALGAIDLMKLAPESLLVPLLRVSAMQQALFLVEKDIASAKAKLTKRATLTTFEGLVSKLDPHASSEVSDFVREQLSSAMLRAAIYVQSKVETTGANCKEASSFRHVLGLLLDRASSHVAQWDADLAAQLGLGQVSVQKLTHDANQLRRLALDETCFYTFHGEYENFVRVLVALEAQMQARAVCVRYDIRRIPYTVYRIPYTGIRYTVYGIRVYGIRYTVYGIRYNDTVYGIGIRYTVYGIIRYYVIRILYIV